MKTPWKKKQEFEARFNEYYADGYILHRSDDFYERVQTFILRSTKVQDLSNQIKDLLASFNAIWVYAPEGGSRIYVYGETWKASIELAWLNEEVSYYRFWFAEPPKKQRETLLEMNIAATAIEKAVLSITHNAMVIVTYASPSERAFKIGPKDATSKLPSISSFFSATFPQDLAFSFAESFSQETSIKIIEEYLSERKSEKKLGSNTAKGLLGDRFLGTPACLPSVMDYYKEIAEQKKKVRFCRKCGTKLPEGSDRCAACGTLLSTAETSASMSDEKKILSSEPEGE